MQDYFAVTEPAATCDAALGKDELNAVCYAAGFVPHILLIKNEQRTDRKSSQHVQCLRNIAVGSSHTDSLPYTTEWITRLYREGCFLSMIRLS